MSGLADKIRKGEAIPWPVAALLRAATPAQRVGMWWRLRGPRTGVAARVVSYGNITAGGTGKTPAVIERAREEVAAGRRVAILTRGHGSRKTPEPFLVLPSDPVANRWEEIGDEPALIRHRVPGVAIVKSADRVAGARTAVGRAGCDVIILDDGFQAVALARDEDWVCIDAANPFGNGHLLPRGILREPLKALHRASGFILTRCDAAPNAAQTLEQLARLRKGVPIRTTRHAPTGLWRVCDGAPLPLEALQGANVAAACGIAHPETFFHTLETLGARLTARVPFPDHHPVRLGAVPPADLTLVTEKDAIRMHAPPPHVYALQIDLQDFPLPPH